MLDPAVGLVPLDQERVQQVVSNLVANALKFTPQGGRVEVRTTREGDHVSIVVSDSGIGFDESFAARLFQPFEQADASSRREHGGLGLGLSIAKHLIELHGGTVDGVSSGVGCGATFTVTLPAPVVSAYQPERSQMAAPLGN